MSSLGLTLFQIHASYSKLLTAKLLIFSFSTDPLHPLVSWGRGELLLAEDDGLITKVTSAVGGDGELSQVSPKQVGHSHL